MKRTPLILLGLVFVGGAMGLGILPLVLYKEGYKELWDYINPLYGINKAYEQSSLKDGRNMYGKLYYASGPVVNTSSGSVEIKVRKFNNIRVGLDETMTTYYSLASGAVAKPLLRGGDVIGLVYGNFRGKQVAYEVWVE